MLYGLVEDVGAGVELREGGFADTRTAVGERAVAREVEEEDLVPGGVLAGGRHLRYDPVEVPPEACEPSRVGVAAGVVVAVFAVEGRA